MTEDKAPEGARLRLFGGFALAGRDARPVAISSRRGRGLLAYLFLAPEQGATRERLCGLLWSDRGETQARASLRQCLLELRDNLSSAGVEILDVGRERIAIRPGAISSDVGDLQRALAGDDTGALARTLGALGDGRLLDDLDIGGLFQDWLEQTRTRLDQSIATGVQNQLERLEGVGEWGKVRTLAEAYLRRDELDEAVVTSAIRADAATGNALAAHRRFKILQDAMDREFKAAPGPAARDALARVGAQGPPPPMAAPSSGSVSASDSGASVPATASDAAAPPLVVVALFESGESGGEGTRLATNLRDEVVSGLARFRDLRIVADSRPIDRLNEHFSADLGAAYVLGVSFRAGQGGGRLIAQLLRIHDRQVIWSDRLEAPGLDVVETIDGIIAQVVGAILPAIDADLVRNPSRLPADSLYNRYLLASDAATRARTFDQARAAADRLEELVADAPAFALPYLPLAKLYNTDFGLTRAGASGPDLRARALALAKSALALDRGHVHGYTIAGWCYLRRREWDTGRAYLEQAFALNPFHPRRVMEVGYGFLFLGETERARALLDRHLLLNPEPDDYFFMDLGLLTFVQGDHGLAASYLELIAKPDIWGLIYKAMVAKAAGLPCQDKTEAARRAIADIWPDTPMTVEAVVDWIGGHHPFQSAEVQQRFLGAARAILTPA
ncbi:MAG: BTAD domain-containing putative transcriptional regulator [Caulobacteraceae bacterium]